MTPQLTVLETKTADVLRRIGVAIGPDDARVVRALVPFVIDAESLHPIPPLAALPPDAVAAVGAARLRYRNVPLPPVPVLAPALARPLLAGAAGIDKAFVDGQNVYGANVFEQHEGRRLLRRVIGYVHDELAAELDAFDILAYESDGFLVATARRPNRFPLRDLLLRIIARITAEADDERAAATRDRLATFYRHARGAFIAPATVSYEPRDDLDHVLAARDLGECGTVAERLERLRRRDPRVSTVADAIATRAPAEQDIVVGLVEHRVYDPVLEPLTHVLERADRPVIAFREPGGFLRWVQGRGVRFFRMELVSLLKAINEDPLGGFLAGNEALRAIYRVLVSSLHDLLDGSVPARAADLPTFRRWGDFYFALDAGVADASDVCRTVRRAFRRAKYVGIESMGRNALVPGSTVLLESPPPADASRIVVPIIPVVAADAVVSDDILAMPIEQPGQEKRREIADRLDAAGVPDVDVAFVADWTLNACDPNRGIPRLVQLAGASDADIADLAQFYEARTNRKGRSLHRVRRDARTIEEVRTRLRRLLAAPQAGE